LADFDADAVAVINRLVAYMEVGADGAGREDEYHGDLAEGLMAATGLEHSVRWRGVRLWRPDEMVWPLEGGHISRVEWPDVGGVGALAVSREPVGAWLGALAGDDVDYDEVPAALTPEESGMVTYVLCRARRVLVERGLPPVELSVQPPDGDMLRRLIERGGGAVQLTWVLRAGRSVGFCRLLCPRSWLHGLETSVGGDVVDAAPSSWSSVAIDTSVYVGGVRLRSREWHRAQPGAVVLLDDHGILVESDLDDDHQSGDAPVGAAKLMVGGRGVVCGRVAWCSASRCWQFRVGTTDVATMDAKSQKETTMGGEMSQRDETESGEGAEATVGRSTDKVAPTEMLERPDVEIEVRMGSAAVSVGELFKLAEGSVVELSARPGEPVELLANGECVATGELVTVDGHIGVRIIERR
jgi:type III secretion system YscQ/HrcQ family protein